MYSDYQRRERGGGEGLSYPLSIFFYLFYLIFIYPRILESTKYHINKNKNRIKRIYSKQIKSNINRKFA